MKNRNRWLGWVLVVIGGLVLTLVLSSNFTNRSIVGYPSPRPGTVTISLSIEPNDKASGIPLSDVSPTPSPEEQSTIPVENNNESIERFRSISSIKPESGLTWRSTYQAYGRNIVVDIQVQVPDVNTLSVLRVDAPYVPADEQKSTGGYFTKGNLEEIRITIDGGKLHLRGRNMFQVDGIAENCPTYPTEVFGIVRDTLNKELSWSLSLMEKGQVAYSRAYGRLYEPGDNVPADILHEEYYDIDMSKPISDSGYYELRGLQLLQGVSVFDGTYFLLSYQSDPVIPNIHVDAYVYDGNNIRVDGFTVKHSEAIAQDVPILSFEVIKQTIEQYINSGLLRDVQSVQLGYMLMLEGDSAPGCYVTVPVWCVRGVLYADGTAEKSTLFETAGHDYYIQQIAGDELRIFAQSGEVIEKSSAEMERYFAPRLILWEEANQGE